jgi:SAM-dependent methyltransferase
MERLYFPATQGNRQPIWETLKPRLPAVGRILEIASGSGEHLAHFAERSPNIQWTPSDPEPAHRASQAAWCRELTNVEAPLNLDCLQQPWPLHQTSWDGILAINLIHISPWEVTSELFKGAQRWLKPDGWLYLYGAYLCQDTPTAPSNLAFDQQLRAQNPLWGVRKIEEVQEVAKSFGFRLTQRTQMPSNNLSLFFSR